MGENSAGTIITFYSYKGGTGRTMALANIACILASRQARQGGKGVLMVDWDLEAPGLHRYFRNHLRAKFSAGGRTADDPVAEERGLIDLFYDLSEKTDRLLAKGDSRPRSRRIRKDLEALALDSEEVARQALEEIRPEDYVLQTTIPHLHLLKAGRFDPDSSEKYAAKVNTFDWESLFGRSPKLFQSLAERLSEKYQYVLIDSRTGITDISGICTMLLPEKLVMVFTPNLQSLAGGVDVVRRAAEYRKGSPDARPLVCFPLVSRVENSEEDLRHQWRVGHPDKGIKGYEPAFEALLNQVYGLAGVELEDYFDEMLVPHVPKYAYGEEIAVLSGASRDKLSLTRAYEVFADKLINSDSPWAPDHLNSATPRGDYVSNRWHFLAGAAHRFRTASPFLVVGLFFLSIFLAALVLQQLARAQDLNARFTRAEADLAREQTLRQETEAKLSQLATPADTLRKLQEENALLNDQLNAATEARVQAEERERSAAQQLASARAQARRHNQAVEEAEALVRSLQNELVMCRRSLLECQR